MPRRLLSAMLACAGLFALPAQSATSPADYVNTLQGTNSKFELTRGNTYPVTGRPFGMNLWAPQTGPNGDGWKYQYFKDTIRGFQQAHQCSSWTNDYAVFSLMPVAGKLTVDENERAAKFSHQNETAKPYYYQVKLGTGVNVEMSGTERGAFLRFAFPNGKDAFVVMDGYTGPAEVKILPRERKIVGWVRNGRQIPGNFRNYFVIVFDKPFIGYGTWGDGNSITEKATERQGEKIGAYVQFRQGETVQAKVASSYISPEQAELNLQSELGKFARLEDAKAAGAAAWNRYLSKIVVEGGTDEQLRTFYSCFFRASLFPRMFFEIGKDGKPHYFSPYDGKVKKGYMYTDTGFWDTFRAQLPLNSLLHPEMHGRYMVALLDAYDQCGWLPSWSFPGEAGSMIGNHAISVLADAWVKGIRTFDPKKALKAYRHEATEKGPWGPANGRHGHEDYYRLGYVAYPETGEATAKTLEYAYDDFCGYKLAMDVGEKSQADFFAKSMRNYLNVFDPETGFMRGKDRSGNWTPADFNPIEWGGPFTEGCAWHYLWSVFHDVGGLIDLLGGDEKFVEKMDRVFTETNQFEVGTYGGVIHEMREMEMANMGQYAHGNQPIQHMIYLYNYAGAPWKAQFRAREVMEKLYDSTENGYPGDEDQGQTSSWYVMSALGFYSVCPGTDEYVLGSPVFEKATISLENGRKFTVLAKGNSKRNVYIQSAKLNGKPHSANFIRHSDIVAGGVLELEMGPEPNKQRGTRIEDRPFSLTPYGESAKESAASAPR
jgi:alpha-1,2-mannosidase, putative